MLLKRISNKLLINEPIYLSLRNAFSVSASCLEIQKLTRLRVVDNSEIGKRAMAEGKPPKCIHVYNKTGVGKIGIHT